MWISPKPDDSKCASRCHNEVAGVVSKRYASEDWEWSVELKSVSFSIVIVAWYRRVLTLAPILPLIVITAPMIALPSTRAPIANLQLRPLAIMEDAE